jgi:hypothetical protein
VKIKNECILGKDGFAFTSGIKILQYLIQKILTSFTMSVAPVAEISSKVTNL